VTLRQGLRTVEVADAVLESARSGGTVELDALDWETGVGDVVAS
jgi:hypothetical protein